MNLEKYVKISQEVKEAIKEKKTSCRFRIDNNFSWNALS